MPEFEAITKPKIENASVEFDAELLEFSFDVNKVTPRWFKEQERLLGLQDVETVAKALHEIIVAWNLTMAGEPAEPSVETLARFPLSHLMKMMEAISEIPSRAEGEVSSGDSSPSPRQESPASTQQQPESQPMPLNGAEASPLPAPSASPSPT